MEGLTREELISAAEHMRWNPEFPVIRHIARKVLTYFDSRCPNCRSNIRGNALIVRVLKESPDLDFVSYICKKCGTIFHKYEDKREEVI